MRICYKENPKMTLREWLPLCGMTLSAFIFNTSEFMPIGLLTDIAADFHTTEAHAGMLITIYAWVVMAMSLPLMILFSRCPLRPLLLGVMALFAISQVGSAISTGYYTLLASRIGVACAHAIFWSIASPIAVRIVPEKYQSTAMGMIVTGTSIAMIFGLPLGRFIGLYAGWRSTFACVAVISFLVLAYLFFMLPKVSGNAPFAASDVPKLFKNPVLAGIFLLSFLVSTAYYTGYSYIEPFLLQISHLPEEEITMILTLFGVAGLLGSFLFSTLYSAHRYSFIAISIFNMALALFLLYPIAESLSLIIGVSILWGLSATAFNVALQAETIQITDDASAPVAMSIFSGIFNLGIGFGTWLGGMLCTYLTIAYIGFAGSLLALTAMAYCLLFLIPAMKRK